MGKHIQLEIKLLKDKTEIENAIGMEYDEYMMDTCGEYPGWLERWETRFNYIRPGISPDEVLAIEGFSYADPALGFLPSSFAATTKDFLCEEFSPDDILACAGGMLDGYSVCHFLIFPLYGRQINPTHWIDSRSLQFTQDIRNRYIGYLSAYFMVDLSADLEIVDNGHTEYLDSFPQVQTAKEDCQELPYTTVSEEDQVQTDYPKDRIKEIINTTVKYFTTGVDKGDYIKLMRGDITVDSYLDHVRDYLHRMYPDISGKDCELVVKKVRSAATGFYILDDLINDDNISDIKVVSPYKIRVKVNGQRKTSNLKFIDYEDYLNFIDNILTRYSRDKTEQIHVFTDTTSNAGNIIRNNLTLGGINTGGCPVYHIRKIPRKKNSLDDLIKKGMMDRTTANYLVWAAREAKGIVFTGKGSSGKTTLMNTLLEYTPSNRSGVIIQESEELFSNKPELTFEHITGKYDLKELAKNGLLTDIDYFVIGEVKGDEAMYFINACDTGNKGWCSVHSPSSEEAINKLADYVMYASKYNREEALHMLKELQVVVFMKDFKVAEISEVTGWDKETKNLTYRTVLRRNDLVGQKLPTYD